MKIRLLSAACLFTILLLVSLAWLKNKNDALAFPEEFTFDNLFEYKNGDVCQDTNYNSVFVACYNITYYEVLGISKPEIISQLNTEGPGQSWGTATTELFWGSPTTELKGKEDLDCSMGVKTVIILPKHKSLDKLSSDLKHDWQTMINALTMHEINHHKIATQVAWDEFRNGCPNVPKAVEKFNDLNKAYDIETLNGYCEGVKF